MRLYSSAEDGEHEDELPVSLRGDNALDGGHTDGQVIELSCEIGRIRETLKRINEKICT